MPLVFFVMAPTNSKKFNWGIPVSIPVPPFGNGDVPAWTDLKFNPLGIYNLCRRLGVLAKEPGVFTQYQHRFEASNIAWFAAGTSEDGNHHIPDDSFHVAFNVMCSHLPAGSVGVSWRKTVRSCLQKLIFDLVR